MVLSVCGDGTGQCVVMVLVSVGLWYWLVWGDRTGQCGVMVLVSVW